MVRDLFSKCRPPQEYHRFQDLGVYPYFQPLQATEGPEAILKGRRVIMAGSNNYLGLTHDPRVIRAAQNATARYGTGCTGSRFLNGTLELHLELEARIAALCGKEAALVFSTGYQTCLGVIQALVNRDEWILCDRDNHASIIDGSRLSFGEVKKYRHGDLVDLESRLEAGRDRAMLVVTDGVFSMMGDLAPLPGMVDLARQYGARLLVDDAHGFGVLGSRGAGTADHFGLDQDVDLIMGTFSKSLAGIGGFCAGPKDVIEYIRHRARTMIFSASVPAGVCAAAITCLDIIESEPERRRHVIELASKARAGLQQLGFNTGPSETPVVPVILGDRMRIFRFWNLVLEEGVFTNPVTAPGVPPGMDLLRCSFMATHTEEHVERFLDAFARARNRLEKVDSASQAVSG
ncbi:MAG: aminotransferase class I/II-fold pyridoxal phosphate-dependent enzyme [Planctomycetota bacterium]|nr:MAG: aminotransferase class I/II-fold pyridoxal phosphate-dependent enzyme [Planctomycetota bacterium]